MKTTRWKIAQWFEKKWWNNYLQKKNTKEYLSWKKKYWNNFLKSISFEIKSDSKILDIGCGPAGTFILSKQITNNKWTALDPLIDNYKKLAVFKPTKYPHVEFINSTFENFQSNKIFTTIFCINAINHFININGNLNKLYSLMEKDSTLILSLDTHNYTFLKWILYSLPLDILHPHQYTDTEYEKMFLSNNFKIAQKKLVKKEFIFSYYVYVLKKK